MDALAITNYVLAVSCMVATALTIAAVLFGTSGGMVMSLLVKPASMRKDGLSGWTHELRNEVIEELTSEPGVKAVQSRKLHPREVTEPEG